MLRQVSSGATPQYRVPKKIKKQRVKNPKAAPALQLF